MDEAFQKVIIIIFISNISDQFSIYSRS